MFIVWNQLLAALPDAVKLEDGTWEATCPAHGAAEPRSLIARPLTSATRISLFCRAGCTAGRIYAEIADRVSPAPAPVRS